MMAAPAFAEVARMRGIIMEAGLSGELPGLNGKLWYEATTARIDLLKTAEDRIAQDLAALAMAVHAQATRALIGVAVGVVLAVAACGGIVILIARGITRPLDLLAGAMKQLAGGDTGLIIPCRERRDEIGGMAQAVEVFKQDAVERLRLEAEHKDAQTHANVRRRAALHRLAETFESAAGSI